MQIKNKKKGHDSSVSGMNVYTKLHENYVKCFKSSRIKINFLTSTLQNRNPVTTIYSHCIVNEMLKQNNYYIH